jgi:hypothetical protein
MANTGIYHGSDALVYIGTTAVGHATSHTLDVKSEVIVRRTKDTGKFPTRKVTGLDASVSMEALVLYDGYSFKDVLTAQLTGEAITLKLAGHSNDGWGVPEEDGDWYIEMGAVISGNNGKWPVNQDASYNASFDLSGELEIKTVDLTP